MVTIERSYQLSKGNQVNIPEPRLGYHFVYGNINEPRYASGVPEKSSLFFLTIAKKHNPGISLSGDRVKRLAKHFKF
jgi:hypothetical protein